MKIAHVVDSMEVGGAEILVSQLSRLQRQQGHDPRIYAIAALGALGQQMRDEGFAVQSNIGHHLPDAVRNFCRLFKESRPDVVHLHNPTPTIYAAAAARMAGAAGIVSTRHSLVAPPRKFAVELKYALAARFCDWIVGICDATTANLRSLHGLTADKIVRVYNGAVPLTRMAQAEDVSKSYFTLVYVGRLAPVKNHALLLNAFHSALLSMPNLRLWMVGDGTERKALEGLASELNIASKVRFWGQQLDVAPFFSAADAFVMSSRSEGLPISLLQAFSIGVPAIVTDVGGMAEVVRLAGAGYTVSPTNPEEMAEAILRLASSAGERERLSVNASAAFKERFTLQAMVDAYMELYQKTPRSGRVNE